jgi:CTP:phosphocholine cytidylyltransferase-like protein
VTLICALLLSIYTISSILKNSEPASGNEHLTIRVNTFRRLDSLEIFLDYYATCDVVKQIQVVWSDQENAAPLAWTEKYPDTKVLFELHKNNSLSNRFRPLTEILTQAVLSIDDDLIVPCDDLSRSLNVWSSNKRVLVGYSPRMHTYNIDSGTLRYLNWQFTWWNGIYTIMLTKATILDQKYLFDYDKVIPKTFLEHIDQSRNCEDIAMAYVVALKSHAAPVWVQSTVYETTTGGISSGASHFDTRSHCLDILHAMVAPHWSWVTGHQKAVALSWLDWGMVMRDVK